MHAIMKDNAMVKDRLEELTEILEKHYGRRHKKTKSMPPNVLAAIEKVLLSIERVRADNRTTSNNSFLLNLWR